MSIADLEKNIYAKEGNANKYTNLAMADILVQKYLEENQHEKALETLEKIRNLKENFNPSQKVISMCLKSKVKDMSVYVDFDQVMDEVLEELKIEKGTPKLLFPSTIFEVSKDLMIKGHVEEAIKALQFMLNNKPMMADSFDSYYLKDMFNRLLASHTQVQISFFSYTYLPIL